ncbi:MBL fold metallo-hydrolase [Aquincola sp. MAHUQ-54]|uniref:MBL fold metallo-hydrolase n=1 Tax=Aquincola agrisoli TaxID=3119538 RepID=A0AAW9QD63_9BURK
MANHLEQQLVYPLGDTLPEPGETLEVAPGVRWLRMPLPFALDHINLWLLRDRLDGREGWAIVDCGVDNADIRGLWEQVFATQLQGRPVLRVIVTHMHPDHIGLAHWLTARWQCRLWISATDYGVARLARDTRGQGGDESAEFFAAHGLRDAETLDILARRGNHFAQLVPALPDSYRRLLDGQLLAIGDARWRCIAGYGHAPEHISLHDAAAGVLVAGDMVLPRISTNVGVSSSEPEGDPLPLYLDSIARVAAELPAGTLVLPSHGRPFRGLHTRVAQLRQHHDERLADVLAALQAAPATAAEMLPVLFRRPLDAHQTTFAMAEALAHLHMLWHGGRLERGRGADGVYRFARRMPA